ncbi:unnamed protein product [Miscanthus lutarioriparius]|uniref:Uncharacterized protein n=1 Tax=Miscanthus lutarioriparius TaxID=422564 RepID=A0A811PCV9_9POAL|nr:unnamed protein product [Miscanthus lutarioriparius]
MGCGQSKIDQEEAVCRCRERKRLMADAVVSRNGFAAAHTGYTVRLKSTGGALSDFAQGEAPNPSLVSSHTHHAPAAAAASVSTPPGPSAASVSSPSPPPPPPFADFSHSSLQRLNQTPPMPATAMLPPPVLESQMATWDYFFGPTPTPPPTLEQPADDTLWMERHDNEPVAEVKAPVAKPVVSEPAATEERPPQTDAEKEKAIEEMVANLPPSKPIVRKPPKAPGPPPAAHYQHASSMGAVETRKGKNLPDHEDLNDNFDTDDRFETHAAVLDRMLAWEKKLYDEVKAGELMKIDYQKKVSLLQKQKKRGVKLETLEKTKAAVSYLHTRYIVDMQSMDSTVSEINRLLDRQLFPKLVDLVDGMAKMWSSMHRHHQSQFLIISGIRGFEIPPVPRETTDSHYIQTCELRDIVREWHTQFEKLMDNQKAYIRALNAWLKLNLIPIESNIKEKVSSPPRLVDPPIKHLLHAWHDELERLPIELAKTAIKTFAEVISNIVHLQEEEVNLRRRCDETRRDLTRKRAQFEDWHQNYLERRAAFGEDTNPDAAETKNIDPVEDRKRNIEELEVRLREEEGHHLRHARQVREKSLANLRTHLPELFRNMADFAYFCHDMYNNLRKTAVLPKD